MISTIWKTTLTSCFMLFLGIQFSTAQEAYIRLGGGYGISASNDVFTLHILEQDSNLLYISDKSIYGTLGAGAQFRLCGGYTFSQNFGLELDVNYLIGQKKYAGGLSSPYRENSTYAYTRQMRLTPSFFVRANPGLLQPYVGMGVVIPVLGKTVLEEEATIGTTQTYKERSVNGSFSLGFDSYAGVNIRWPNEKFNIFVEVRYTALRIKSKKATVVQWTSTNTTTGEVTDILETAATYVKETIFVDELTTSSNAISGTVYSANLDQDKPLEALASKTNFNAIGLNIGVCMRFGKAATTKELLD